MEKSQIPDALQQFMNHFENKNKNATSSNQDDLQSKLQARNEVLKLDFKLLQKYPIVSMFVMPANPHQPNTNQNPG